MKKQPLNIIKSCVTDIDIKGPSRNKMTRFAKEFCYSVGHTGCIKMNSNIASIEHYETVISGMQMYFKHAEDVKSKLSTSKINATNQLHLKHNIVDFQLAILNAYLYDCADNIFSQMRPSPFWSLIHDGISKFGIEFNGVCIRTLGGKNEHISVPYCIRRCLELWLVLTQAVINNITGYIKLGSSSAFEEIMTYLR